MIKRRPGARLPDAVFVLQAGPGRLSATIRKRRGSADFHDKSQGSAQAIHDRIVHAADGRTDFFPPGGVEFVSLNLGDLEQAIGGRRLHRQPEKRRINHVRGDQAQQDAGVGVSRSGRPRPDAAWRNPRVGPPAPRRPASCFPVLGFRQRFQKIHGSEFVFLAGQEQGFTPGFPTHRRQGSIGHKQGDAAQAGRGSANTEAPCRDKADSPTGPGRHMQ